MGLNVAAMDFICASLIFRTLLRGTLARNYLEDVSRIPLTAPKVERATKTGIIQAIYPYKRLAKVWKKRLRVIFLPSWSRLLGFARALNKERSETSDPLFLWSRGHQSRSRRRRRMETLITQYGGPIRPCRASLFFKGSRVRYSLLPPLPSPEPPRGTRSCRRQRLPGRRPRWPASTRCRWREEGSLKK